MKLRCRLPLALLLFSSLFATAQTDSADCLGPLFRTKLKAADRRKISLVLPGGKRSSLPAFWKANFMEQYGQAALFDLDRDGSKELLLNNFTGGAHCCDELTVFKNTGPNQYTQTARLFAGGTCYADSVFVFDLHEAFGYFFTCYACGLEKGKALREPEPLRLRYAGGRMTAVPGDEALRKRILQNLAYLKKLGWAGPLKEGEFDDGRRKELALNLAAHYFSFGQNLAATKQLFEVAYPWKDAAAVWKEFSVLLNNAKKNAGL